MTVGQWAVFDGSGNEWPMPEPDTATYYRPTIGEDADGVPIRSVAVQITWSFAADPRSDGGLLTVGEYAKLKECIQANADLTLRTMDEDDNFVKLRGKSVDFVPGVTRMYGLALGVYIAVNDCEAV